MTDKSKESPGKQGQTHFGYRTVADTEKSGMVADVFHSVASRYDLMNDLMSGGMHRLWKASMLDALKPSPTMRLLDVAGGTGDIAFRFLERADEAARRRGKQSAKDAHATLLDINASMLNVGRDRARKRGLGARLDWICADAEKLPLEDRSVDAYTIAFGIRNVTHIQEALNEAYRVLRPGGHFLCLEFSQVILPVIDEIYEKYSFKVIPEIGGLVARDRDSYQYLVESIRRFPSADDFAAMIEKAGFDRVSYRRMTGGVVALHSGWRI